LTPLGRAAFSAVRPFLSRALGAGPLGSLYRSLGEVDASQFADRVLGALHVRVRCSANEFALVPERGALVVTANHPHGMLDGLVAASLLARVRPDVRLLANYVLSGIPELHDRCFFVDPFDGPHAAARSRAGLRAAHLWLRQGGAVVVFPSGSVAPVRDPDGVPVDDEWRLTAARLAVHAGASVLPLRISGSNTPFFYAAGRLHPLVRTALLPRELLRARRSVVTVRVAAPFSVEASLTDTAEPARVTARARAEVERLARDARGAVDDEGRRAMEKEIAQLPESACLASSGTMRVYCADASALSATLGEIGRLRALSYAAAGEGHGGDTDLDAFDRHYLHLFSWDAAAGRVAGAYRIGRTDAISAVRGLSGLYTSTLFRYDERFLASMPPALELGRAFVRPEYQRNHNALSLLWKGIGAFVARHPHYRVLFGPVSISARYADSSQLLMRRFLEQHHLDARRSRMVSSVNPPGQPEPDPVDGPDEPEDLDRLIRAAEADGKGMPVLLRQYLKLGARLVAFNVDHAFGDVVDALMTVDLGALDRTVLQRYMGREGAAAFLAYHAADHAA
jgi:putative hemolysin